MYSYILYFINEIINLRLSFNICILQHFCNTKSINYFKIVKKCYASQLQNSS